MKVSINQPCYLGWMGYFDRIAKSDLHIVLDHVQLEKGGFTNRTRIMQPDGRVMWLTIPVEHGKPIRETKASEGSWRRKHIAAVRQSYGDVAASRLRFLVEPESDLGLLCLWSFAFLVHDMQKHMEGLENPQIRTSSELGGVNLGTKSDLVLNLCKEVGATTYLSGPHGRDYLDLASFSAAGIEVEWHDYPAQQPILSAVHDLFSGEKHAHDVQRSEGVPQASR